MHGQQNVKYAQFSVCIPLSDDGSFVDGMSMYLNKFQLTIRRLL